MKTKIEILPGEGGVPYFRKLGFSDAQEAGRKRKRAVTQNFKLAYLIGWWEGRKACK